MFFSKKLPILFPDKIEIGDVNFEIEVIFLKKKSSSVVIKGKKLIFRLSTYMSKKNKEKHFKELLLKISKKIEKSPIKNIISIKEVLENGFFVFAGDKFLVEYTKNRGIRLKENIFFINFKTRLEIIEKKIIKLLCERYYLRLKNYVDILNEKTYNYNLVGFELKNLNSKWGHCTHDNKILINLKLLNTDFKILDYVIIHELVHIKVKNHSKNFWKEVSKFCPNYKIYRKVLKENSPVIFNLNEK